MPTVLLIEDSETQAVYFKNLLGKSGFEVEHRTRLDEGLARVRDGGIDVVLLDLTLPDSSGLATFLSVSSVAVDIPVVVLTGLDDERVANMAIERGAQDYLVKDELTDDWLRRAVKHAIARFGRNDGNGAEEAQAEQGTPQRQKSVIELDRQPGAVVITFKTQRLLDPRVIGRLDEKLASLVQKGDVHVIINLQDVDYVSNAAIRTLITAHKRLGRSDGSLHLCSLDDRVRENLSVRQFHRLFTIHDDLDTALAAVAAD